MKKYYTNEKNTLFLIALLKQYGIKRIIVSPGAMNVSFVASVQNDPFFVLYSAYDERSAAFMACGLSYETKEPVVLTCTGATASRNYVPGLTEAFFSKYPVLTVAYSSNPEKVDYYIPQLLNRTKRPCDVVKEGFLLNSVRTKDDASVTIDKINKALSLLKSGPVLLNVVTDYSYNFSVKQLPHCRMVDYVSKESKFPDVPAGKVGIFVGSHTPFEKDDERLIDSFCDSYNAIVICDQTSNYRGKYRYLALLSNSQQKVLSSRDFDLIIHIGSVSGSYITFKAKEVWRVDADGVFRNTFGTLTKIFHMSERAFFAQYSRQVPAKPSNLLEICKKEREEILQKIMALPFSNIWIAQVTAPKIPGGSVVHLGILNSLRAWNFFETPSTVTCFSNTGGFGIDGCLSSAIGAAFASPGKRFYLILGDLAFFYDCNALLNQIPNNLHILVVNNGLGVEFKNYNHRAAIFGGDTDNYIAAAKHNGYKSPNTVLSFAMNNGVDYVCAHNKEEFLENLTGWVESDKAVILEAFTDASDESCALKKVSSVKKDLSVQVLQFLKNVIKKVLRR